MSVTYAQLEAMRKGGFKDLWHARDHAIRHFLHVLERNEGFRERLGAAMYLVDLAYDLLERAVYEICAWQPTNKWFDRAVEDAIRLADMYKDALEYVKREIDLMFTTAFYDPHSILEKHDKPFLVKHNIEQAVWATKRLIKELEELSIAGKAMPYVPWTKGDRRWFHAQFIRLKLRKWLEEARPNIFFTTGHNSSTNHVPDEKDIRRARRCLRSHRSVIDWGLDGIYGDVLRETMLALFEVR